MGGEKVIGTYTTLAEAGLQSALGATVPIDLHAGVGFIH